LLADLNDLIDILDWLSLNLFVLLRCLKSAVVVSSNLESNWKLYRF